MSESEEGVSPERLRELTKVTHWYGAFRQLSGLPLAAMGAWGLLALLQSVAGPDRTHLLFTPVLWAIVTPASRRLYQSHGVVVQRSFGLWWIGGLALAAQAILLLTCVIGSTWYLTVVSRGWAVALAMLVLTVIIGYAVRVGCATDHALLWSIFIAADAARDRSLFTGGLWGVPASVWCVWILVGIGGHLLFPRLGRRMAASRREGA